MNDQKKNNIPVIIGVLVAFAAVVGGFIYFNGNKEPETITLSTGEEFTFPTVAADYNAIVVSIEGNELVISKPLVTQTVEEQEAAREERKSMTPEERQASREDRNTTSERVEETIIIPIGVPMLKNKVVEDAELGSNLNLNQNDSSGLLGDPDQYDMATFEDIVEGSNISIWTDDNGNIILVRIKGGNQ